MAYFVCDDGSLEVSESARQVQHGFAKKFRGCTGETK
jgi:hypothetical protein